MTDLSNFNGILFGYARVSTVDQDLSLQRTAMLNAGIKDHHIFEDKKSGRTLDRKGLKEVTALMRRGDCLVVWRLDRLGRNARDIRIIVDQLQSDGIGFRSLKEGIDSTTPAGKLMLTMLAAMAEFESDVTSERTRAGMAEAKRQGRTAGRKHYILNYPKRLARFTELWLDGAIPDGWMSAAQIIAEMNACDPKAPKMKSTGSYGNWKAKGFPGFVRPES